MILAGRVAIDGTVVRTLGTRADPTRDIVTVDGERIGSPSRRRVLLLHKPRGVVTTLHDPQGRETVRDLLDGIDERVFPVGRLDMQTTGLVLLTNDGALAAQLAHPRTHVARVYRVKVHGRVDARALARLRRGVRLADGIVRPSAARIVQLLPTKTWLELTLHEGRWHVVRRLFETLGYPVDKLARVAFGPLRLGKLAPGAWRELRPQEVARLEAAVRDGGSVAGERGEVTERRGSGRPSNRRRLRQEDRSPREAHAGQPPGSRLRKRSRGRRPQPPRA